MTNSTLAAGDSTEIQAVKANVCMATLEGVARTLSAIQPGTCASRFTRAKARHVPKSIDSYAIYITYIFHRAVCPNTAGWARARVFPELQRRGRGDSDCGPRVRAALQNSKSHRATSEVVCLAENLVPELGRAVANLCWLCFCRTVCFRGFFLVVHTDSARPLRQHCGAVTAAPSTLLGVRERGRPTVLAFERNKRFVPESAWS